MQNFDDFRINNIHINHIFTDKQLMICYLSVKKKRSASLTTAKIRNTKITSYFELFTTEKTMRATLLFLFPNRKTSCSPFGCGQSGEAVQLNSEFKRVSEFNQNIHICCSKSMSCHGNFSVKAFTSSVETQRTRLLTCLVMEISKQAENCRALQ